MTPEAMVALATKHGMSELNRDFETALATMTGSGTYYFYPYRLHITGREPIFELWSRLFPPGGPIRCFDPSVRLPETRQFTEYINPDSVAHFQSSVFVDEHGEQIRSNHVTQYHFEGDLMKSETVYLDAVLMRYFDRVFDDSYRALPGVVQI